MDTWGEHKTHTTEDWHMACVQNIFESHWGNDIEAFTCFFHTNQIISALHYPFQLNWNWIEGFSIQLMT